MKNCVIVIPALNPNEKLCDYVRLLSEERFLSILIIDDGSSHTCQTIFDRCSSYHNVTVVRHSENKGKGRALKNAFAYILNDEQMGIANGVITADADGQHELSDVMKLCQSLSEDKSKLVLGVRSFDTENVPLSNKMGNTITRHVFRLLYGKHISDTQTGLRGIAMDSLHHFTDLEGERFSYETNMLIAAVRQKLAIEECPIETVYINENESSHFNPFKDSAEIYWVLFKNFFKFMGVSLTSFILDITLFQLFILILGFTFARRRILISTILARAGSSLFNYCMNRSVVFKSRRKWNKTIIGYYSLAVAEAVTSGLSVYLLFQLTGFREVFLKAGVDLVIFLVSYRIQKLVVFKD
jgi:dolichol-phosphate mannosyltransferase